MVIWGGSAVMQGMLEIPSQHIVVSNYNESMATSTTARVRRY